MRSIPRLTACLLFLCATFAHADDASKHAAIVELFQLTHMQDRVQQTSAAALAQAKAFGAQQVAALNLPQESNRSMETYYKSLYELIATKYDWAKLEPAYEKIYADVYSEEELRGILAFYKTPVGRSLLAKTPQVTSQMIEVSKQQMDALSPQIQELTAEYMRQLQKQYGSTAN